MTDNIKPKEVTAIINSLLGGVVPKIGVQHITVGRTLEVEAFLKGLDDVKNGHSLVKFWIGEFGSGKSFMLHLLNTVSLKQNFVVSNADFTPENRLYANDFKAVALYSAIMDNIAIRSKPEGGALSTLLDKWIENVVMATAEKHGISVLEVRDEKHFPIIQREIMQYVRDITEVGGFDFATVIIKYYEGYIRHDELLVRNALKWLKGEYRTKVEARQDLGVREIINDKNYYDMLKNFCKFFVSMGYKGFVVNLDEAINLYKISHSSTREKNYEKILTIYNDCFQGKVEHLLINFAGTPEFLSNPRRGLYSYNALKTRLETNRFESVSVRDYSQPVIRLYPLNHNEIFVLIKKLKELFDMNFNVIIDVNDNDIHMYMEEMFNKPGAEEFLTPREVIRDFLNILNVLRQNPTLDKSQLIRDIEIQDERTDSILDGIDEL